MWKLTGDPQRKEAAPVPKAPHQSDHRHTPQAAVTGNSYLRILIPASRDRGVLGLARPTLLRALWIDNGCTVCLGAESIPPRDDHSLLLVEAHDEWEAAEAMALWLRGGPDPSDVTLICGSDSGILDQALARHGLPVIGRSEASPWRGVLQVLPFVLADAWSPLDVRVLGELLSIPSGPVPGWAASRLLRAAGRFDPRLP